MKDTTYNYGAIKDAITKLSSAEIIRENESKTLNSFVNRIKENPIFYKQDIIYKNIDKCKPFEKERLAERFIAQNIKLLEGLNWHDILRENKTLRRELLDDMHVESFNNHSLFEAVHILIESKTKPGFTDFNKEQNAYEEVLSHLTREVVEESDKSEEKDDSPFVVKNAWKFITKNAVSNFNKRYEHLNESEKEVLKVLISEHEVKTSYLDTIKEENKKEISRLISENSDDSELIPILESFNEKLDKMDDKYYTNIDDSILSCIELKESLMNL